MLLFLQSPGVRQVMGGLSSKSQALPQYAFESNRLRDARQIMRPRTIMRPRYYIVIMVDVGKVNTAT
jgi:hypothetical protein